MNNSDIGDDFVKFGWSTSFYSKLILIQFSRSISIKFSLFSHNTCLQIKYTITKAGVAIISGNPDVCSTLDKKTAEQKARLEMFGFPTECPIPEGRRCLTGDKKVDMSKYKSYLGMSVGKMVISANIEHDTVSDFLLNLLH